MFLLYSFFIMLLKLFSSGLRLPTLLLYLLKLNMIRWDSPYETEGEKVTAVCHKGSFVLKRRFEGGGKSKKFHRYAASFGISGLWWKHTTSGFFFILFLRLCWSFPTQRIQIYFRTHKIVSFLLKGQFWVKDLKEWLLRKQNQTPLVPPQPPLVSDIYM